jgi:hypothetical protein
VRNGFIVIAATYPKSTYRWQFSTIILLIKESICSPDTTEAVTIEGPSKIGNAEASVVSGYPSNKWTAPFNYTLRLSDFVG